MSIKSLYESIRWAVSGAILGIGIVMAVGAVLPGIHLPFENAILAKADYGEQFQTIIEGLREHNVNQENMLTEEEMFRIAIDAIYETLGDNHGAYFNPNDYSRFNEELSPTNYTGIGTVLSPSKNGALILQIFDDSLLKFAGVLEGDLIYAAGNPGDDFVVFSWTSEGSNLQELVDTIKGPAGTDVNLKIKRNSSDLGIITVQRIETRAQYVFMKMNANGILDIRVTQFTDTVTDDIWDWLNENDLIGDGGKLSDKVKAVAMDLRFNPGGYLNSAVNLSDLFLEKDLLIVTVVTPDEEMLFKSKYDPLFPPEIPKVFLINGTSASSSEIVSGMAQHHKIAFLLGEKSFGKGSVQSTFDLDGGGAYKTTTAIYLAGGVIEIDGIGLTPGMVVPQPPSPGINDDWQQLNRHLIRVSMDPEIDHQLHAAHEFLMRFVSDRFKLDSEASVRASKELVQQTQTIITKDLCVAKGLKGCPTPSRGGFNSRHPGDF